MVCFCFVNCVGIGLIYIRWYSRTKTTTWTIGWNNTWLRSLVWHCQQYFIDKTCTRQINVFRVGMFCEWNVCSFSPWKGFEQNQGEKNLFDRLVMQDSGLQIVYSVDFLIIISLMNSWLVHTINGTFSIALIISQKLQHICSCSISSCDYYFELYFHLTHWPCKFNIDSNNAPLCFVCISLFRQICSKCNRPVARFQDLVGHNTFLRGQIFCFYYMFNKDISGRNKIWGHKINLGTHCSRIPPRGFGPDV